jgi:DnaK suppressor protein
VKTLNDIFKVSRSKEKVVHNPETIQKFEQTLRRQEKQLEYSMISAVEQGREVAADSALDAADQAVQSYQKEMLFSQGTTGHEQLALVRLALKRLDEGTYGECMHCGKTIGLKRLEALPWTPYCIDCREKIENGEIEDPVAAA